MVQWENRWSNVARSLKASEIRELLKLTENPDIISFAGGLPNPKCFPIEGVEAATKRLFASGEAPRAMQYSQTEGVQELREEIANYLGRSGMHVTVPQTVITNGSQQGLDLIGRVLINPGDYIVTGNPTYLGALQAFNVYGPKYAPVTSDEDGMNPESLEAALAMLKSKGIKPKFIYTIPTFQNPSGTCITEARRKRILELAHEYDVLIVEDDPYGKLRFDGDHIPTLLNLDKGEGRVLYLGTFSKVLVPGFRLAWAAGPREIIQKMIVAKQGIDLCTNAFNQFIVLDMMRTGVMEAHLPKIIDLYRGKRDVMMRAMEEHLPREEMSWTHSKGGMFTWAKLPEHLDAKLLLEEAIKHKVAFVPGQPFHPDGSGKNTVRLNFTHPSDERIKSGIETLGQVIQQALLTA